MEFLGLPAPVVADGAVGEYLYSLGFPREYLASEAIVRAPEMVRKIHEEYVAAGAVLVTTNTFDANTEKLDRHGLAGRCREMNERAARTARKSGAKLVAGSVGPLDPGLSYSFAPRPLERLAEAYLPQIEGLLEGGVDLFLVETQVDASHAREIFRLARSLSSDVPVVVSFTFGPDLLTPSGLSVEEAVSGLRDLDMAAFGANHGISPLQFLDIYARVSAASPFPITLMPNAGLARMSNGIPVFPDTPEHFARCMASCAGERTAMIGGCCGTTPKFIETLVRSLSSGKPRTIRVSLTEKEGEGAKRAPPPVTPPALASHISAKDALVVEILPPRDGEASGFLARAEKLRDLSPTAISIPDSPMGRVRATPGLMGILLRERLGLEPLVHFALRDRNLTRIQSELIGLSLVGLTSVFVIAGDPPSLGDYPQSSAIYELSTDDTLGLISQLCLGKDMRGRDIGQGAFFFPGCALCLSDPGAREKLLRRWDKGARFFITQPVYSKKELDGWERELAEYPVFVSLMPVKDKAQALYLAGEVPGIRIPDKMVSRIEEMDDRDVLAYSTGILSEVMESVRGLASGVYLAGPGKGAAELARKWRK